MTEDEKAAALELMIKRIPTTWTCMRCKREFPNGPFDPPPMARETRMDERGASIIAGDICEGCYGS